MIAPLDLMTWNDDRTVRSIPARGRLQVMLGFQASGLAGSSGGKR
jgi:hypothetical protein